MCNAKEYKLVESFKHPGTFYAYMYRYEGRSLVRSVSYEHRHYSEPRVHCLRCKNCTREKSFTRYEIYHVDKKEYLMRLYCDRCGAQDDFGIHTEIDNFVTPQSLKFYGIGYQKPIVEDTTLDNTTEEKKTSCNCAKKVEDEITKLKIKLAKDEQIVKEAKAEYYDEPQGNKKTQLILSLDAIGKRNKETAAEIKCCERLLTSLVG